MSLLIRPERSEEFAALHAFVKVAFQTAKVSNGDEQNFVDRLRAGAHYLPELALVAEDAGELVGHIMLSRFGYMTAEGPREGLLVAPLAVLLERRSEGIGSALVREAMTRAAVQGFGAAFLVGDPAYYQRFGFVETARYGFGPATAEGQVIPPQYVLVMELLPGALKDACGSIAF